MARVEIAEALKAIARRIASPHKSEQPRGSPPSA